jgi:tetratricopeptide (TPR) repeat protein
MQLAQAGVLLLLVETAAHAGQAPPPADRPATAADRSAAAQAHFELGEMFHKQVFDSLDKAIEAYKEAIKQQADLAEAHYNLGLAYHSKAKLGSDDPQLYRQAVQEYKLYLQYRPNGTLAAKAKQNIAAVEAALGGAPRSSPSAKKKGPPAKGASGQR